MTQALLNLLIVKIVIFWLQKINTFLLLHAKVAFSRRLARYWYKKNARTCTILGLALSLRHSSHVLRLDFFIA